MQPITKMSFGKIPQISSTAYNIGWLVGFDVLGMFEWIVMQSKVSEKSVEIIQNLINRMVSLT